MNSTHGPVRYMDASTDSVKVRFCVAHCYTFLILLAVLQATELDPGYAKAWALLAAARLVSRLTPHTALVPNHANVHTDDRVSSIVGSFPTGPRCLDLEACAFPTSY